MASKQHSFRLATSTGATVAGEVAVADNPYRRFMGLMGKRELEAGAGLYLRPCSSIHMFFMRFPIDVAFIDKDNRVVRLYHGLRPWRMSRIVRRAKAAIELPSGALAQAGVGVGDLLTMS
ncbi:MAG TPA: DUF192 domain-containing protein [Candidatus Acidoferrales bacterium]|nr:DUF192 domain-containing protein [Candidatus Acidoferrales bacterium]